MGMRQLQAGLARQEPLLHPCLWKIGLGRDPVPPVPAAFQPLLGLLHHQHSQLPVGDFSITSIPSSLLGIFPSAAFPVPARIFSIRNIPSSCQDFSLRSIPSSCQNCSITSIPSSCQDCSMFPKDEDRDPAQFQRPLIQNPCWILPSPTFPAHCWDFSINSIPSSCQDCSIRNNPSSPCWGFFHQEHSQFPVRIFPCPQRMRIEVLLNSRGT